jgi:ornithine cyclodeaminase/alanine dehydrogenase-like protein (mu-crystallin family)
MAILLTDSDVRKLLPIAGLADVMELALASFSSGQVNQPVRAAVHVDKLQAFFGVMPAYLSTPPDLGAKLVTVFSGNAARELPAL